MENKSFYSSLFILSLLLFLSSCGGRQQDGDITSSFEIKYARGFSVKDYSSYKVVDIRNPWDTASLLRRYIVVPKGAAVPQNIPKGSLVMIPLKKLAIYNSVHTSIMESLGSADEIAGICETRYIYSDYLQHKIKTGEIADLGESTAPDIEKIIAGECEAIISSPFNNCGYGAAEKTGIPIIEGADYMEPHPLGRCEWIKLFGLLMGKEAKADSIFLSTENEYNKIKDLVSGATDKPTLISERKYGASWIVPEGDSYVARLYIDAGANYIFSNLRGTDSKSLSFEEVFLIGENADFWLMKYYMNRPMTYSDLKAEYAPYENFRAFREHNIYTCNTASNSYYEDITLHPDYILKDLVNIFHPGLLPADFEPRYFKPMEER